MARRKSRREPAGEGDSDEVMQCQITNGIMQAGRPVNEQQEGREWQINCQRCVGAEAVENIVGGDKNE